MSRHLKLIPLYAAALILAAAISLGAGVGAALASGSVTIWTAPYATRHLVIDGVSIGTFPVFHETGKLTFSWTPYWPSYWPTFPNPAHTDKSYKVAVWQNTTPLAATPTWVEKHTSHHWIDDANPTRFTMDSWVESENLCADCPSIIIVQAETIVPYLDDNGTTLFQYIPVTTPNGSGVSALMKSQPILIGQFDQRGGSGG